MQDSTGEVKNIRRTSAQATRLMVFAMIVVPSKILSTCRELQANGQTGARANGPTGKQANPLRSYIPS